MANPEHVELVKRGSEAIDEWRRKHPDLRLQLEGASLDGIQLREADLGNADLRSAHLRDATLYGANLHGSDLRRTNLEDAHLAKALLLRARLEKASLGRANLSFARIMGAELRGAYLGGAKLVGADLSGADLTRANLRGARLWHARLVKTRLTNAKLCDTELRGAVFQAADLDGTDFTNAKCRGTQFADLDLSAPIGLESVRHAGPSTIGVDALHRTRGTIPSEFLRGCGVPQEFIDYIPALVGALEPIQFYSCFISHSSKDDEFARRLHSRLVEEKLRVWYAPEDMKGGRKLIDQIDHAIRVYDKLLLVLSPESMKSNWVATEVERARGAEQEQGEQKLFPIGICPYEDIKGWKLFDPDSGRDLAKEVRSYHIPDFSNWKDHDAFEESFTKLMDDLKAERGPGDAS